MTRPAVAPATSAASGVQRWLDARAKILVPAVLAAGFLLRARVAAQLFFNPDEALYYAYAHQPSLNQVYRVTLTEPHPPLFFFFLYFWQHVGRSEFLLRLPFVLFGTLFALAGFAWLGRAFGRRVAWIGLFLLAFLPTLIAVSAVVRTYILLLLLLAGALYCLERSLAEDSARWMGWFALCLCLAILTHYSTMWFALAVGIYALVRLFQRRRSRRVLELWLASQIGGIALYAFLYVTQISKLLAAALPGQAAQAWLQAHSFHPGKDHVTAAATAFSIVLRNYYFQPGKDHALGFAVNRTLSFFYYLFSFPHVAMGIAMFLALPVAIGLLLAKAQPLATDGPRPAVLALLLFLPFLIGASAGLGQLYPYGGTREDLYLTPFAVAAVAYALAQLGGRRAAPGFAAVAAILLLLHFDFQPSTVWRPQDQRRPLLASALTYLRHAVPPGGPIFSDYQTALLLNHYLCPGQAFPFAALKHRMGEFPCSGYRIISNSRERQLFTEGDFGQAIEQVAERERLEPGQKLWVVYASWQMYLLRSLEKRYPQFYFPAGQTFGANVVVFQVVIPSVEAGTSQ